MIKAKEEPLHIVKEKENITIQIISTNFEIMTEFFNHGRALFPKSLLYVELNV